MEDIQPSQRLRDPNFYAEDGNIVLSAKDADDNTVYFRLHRSTLTKHSPVFKDMFAMPPPASADKYDGAPLVEMAGDSADALRSLIALLYDPQCISVILKDEDFAARMYDPVVLAKKYQVDWIQEMAASHLKKLWPRSLIGWDRIADREIIDAFAKYDPEGYEWDDSVKLHRLPEPVTNIRLARECDAPEIIPLAFLHLLRQPYEINPDHYEDIWDVPERQLLTTDDLKRLALARERIGEWFSSRYGTSWDQSRCESQKPTECHLAVLRSRLSIATAVARDGNFLAASQWVMRNGGRDICPCCVSRFQAELRGQRQEFFDKLSTFFE